VRREWNEEAVCGSRHAIVHNIVDRAFECGCDKWRVHQHDGGHLIYFDSENDHDTQVRNPYNEQGQSACRPK